MQTWSVPLQVFTILKRELPDIPPTLYMQHLGELSRRVRYELMLLATGDHFVDTAQLEDAISHVFIRRRPGTNEILLKYAPTVEYGNLWNAYYRQCRGTVIDMDKMIAWHSLHKFFNIDQMEETSTERVLELAQNHSYQIYNKFDGSCILFYYNDGWKSATNGSFESEQAIWALDFAKRTNLLSWFHKDYTYTCEAIYPSNRIVVNYGDQERLVLLTARHVKTGEEVTITNGIVDSAMPEYDLTLQQILAERDTHPATEKEGWVVYFLNQDLRIKIKCVDYVTVHRLKEHITPEGVFDMIRSDTLDDVRSALPDDIRGEVDAIVRRYVEWERDLRRKVESIQILQSSITDTAPYNKATYMAAREVFGDGTFEQWWAIKYIRGQIDAQESPLMHVKTFDTIAHIFAEGDAH